MCSWLVRRRRLIYCAATMTPGGRDCFSADSSHREIGVVVVRGGRHTITLFRRAGTVHLAAGGHRGRLIGNRRPSVCRRRSATIDGAAKHRRRKSDGSFVRTGPAFALHDRSFRSFARKIDRRHIASLQPLMWLDQTTDWTHCTQSGTTTCATFRWRPIVPVGRLRCYVHRPWPYHTSVAS